MSTLTTLDENLPLRTAGALPSSRTEGMLAEALASDNIDEVKAQLAHVWGHYQSLEFALVRAAQPKAIELIREAIAIDGLQDEDPVAVTVRAIQGPVLEGAYDVAHQTLTFVGIGLAENVPDALRRFLYSDLDHSDPERELSDDDLIAFLEDPATDDE